MDEVVVNDYRRSVSIASNKAALYQALTQAIPLWWSTTEGPSRTIGDEFRVSFGMGSYWVFRIKEAVPNERVVWTCIESHQDHNLQGLDAEWLNTELQWSVAEEGDGVKLSFHHKGLMETGVCYDVCSKAWDFYVMESLKQYLETGKGRPGES